LQRQAAEHGLSDLVLFPGELAQHEIRGLYEKAMAFVIPSVVGADGDMDGVPNVLIEALAIGVPVVGSSVAAIPEVIEDGVTGSLVPAGDAVAIADSLERLLMEPASAEMLIEGGRQRIAAEFDATANAARLVSLFSRRAPAVAARPETDRGS
jgi:colanic acid/amylovoran biosynthesis glycosyltransferase